MIKPWTIIVNGENVGTARCIDEAIRKLAEREDIFTVCSHATIDGDNKTIRACTRHRNYDFLMGRITNRPEYEPIGYKCSDCGKPLVIF